MGENPTRRLVLRAVPDAELKAVQLVERVGKSLGFARDTLAEIKVAVVEACLNAMEYGGGEVEVEVIGHRDDIPWLEVKVTDHGPGFDPAVVPRPELADKLKAQRKRGWGLELIRHFMDEVAVESRPGFTQLRMARHRRGV
jgi:anti-sigma regulatory factor (Ser/Thr protein kinase)